MKSLSEIETLSKRSSKASGFPWGVAEEVGKNIRLLELFGLPGVKNLTQYYLDRKSNLDKIKGKKGAERIEEIYQKILDNLGRKLNEIK